jgi:hypothetical protein
LFSNLAQDSASASVLSPARFARNERITHKHIAASTQLVVFCLVWAQHLTEFPGGSGKTALKRVASNEAYLLLEKATQFTHRASNFPLWDKVWCAFCS